MKTIDGVSYLGDGASGAGGPLWALGVVKNNARRLPVLILQLPDDQQHASVLSRVRDAGAQRITSHAWQGLSLPPTRLQVSVVDGAVVELYTGRSRLHPVEPQQLTPTWWEAATAADGWIGFLLPPPNALDDADLPADANPDRLAVLDDFVARRELYGGEARATEGPLR